MNLLPSILNSNYPLLSEVFEHWKLSTSWGSPFHQPIALVFKMTFLIWNWNPHSIFSSAESSVHVSGTVSSSGVEAWAYFFPKLTARKSPASVSGAKQPFRKPMEKIMECVRKQQWCMAGLGARWSGFDICHSLVSRTDFIWISKLEGWYLPLSLCVWPAVGCMLRRRLTF